MNVYVSSIQNQHQPPSEIYLGEITPHQEVPERAEHIQTAVEQAGHTIIENSTVVPDKLLEQLHSRSYLDFLQTAGSECADSYLYPSVFPTRHGVASNHFLPQFGWHSFDLYTPIHAQIWPVAQASASLAYAAAQEVFSAQSNQRVAYALCRPPGHHAEPDQMGGYCYLNNAAVAAQVASQQGRVAVLDVDFHHGNGTQSIFWNRPEVLTVSIHAEPDWKFPYFAGRADETGGVEAPNTNRNYPLSAGITDEQYLPVLEQALQEIQNFGAEYLVVALGLDTHQADPIGGFALTTEFFQNMAARIAELNVPTVIVQEGGYNTHLLGANAASFLSGF